MVTDVYASSEAPVPGVSGQLVADAAADAGANVRYQPHLTDVVDHLVEVVPPGDLVLTTGAGDVTQLGPMLLHRLGGRHMSDEVLEALAARCVGEVRPGTEPWRAHHPAGRRTRASAGGRPA
jgi:hypothetical protein